ncbi:MAG: hypothetical protein JWO58_1443 [Chitinophagaceae bacterium]|nr:hypothetical protein [Chitinophagaceae bacterium]
MYRKQFINSTFKLLFFFVTCAFLFLNEVNAQSFKGIITAGANACQIDGDRLSGFHKPGWMLGIGVERVINKRWSVLLGIEFMEKGSRSTSKDSLIYLKWKMDYMDIPLVLSCKVHPRFRFQAGITPSVLLNDKIDGGLGYQAPYQKDDAVNFLIAPAVEFFPADNISLLMRYQYSLVRFNSHATGERAMYHNLITVGLRLYLTGEKNNK